MSRGVLLTVFVILLASFNVVSQTPTPAPAQEEVLAIKTDLIQTGVLVFDRKGKFVNGLKREDFELKVDGKPAVVSFFESPSDRKNPSTNLSANNKFGVLAGSKNETIIFFVDDAHLRFDSLDRVKKALLDFIERKKRSDDLAAIFSSSGRIGFLQQFTDDKTVLHTALDRLSPIQKTLDSSLFPMTEYEAQLIDRNDEEVIGKFIGLVMQEIPGITQQAALNMVLARSRAVLEQGSNINSSTYSNLEQVIRYASAIPGRKTILFVSDGFPPDSVRGDIAAYMRRIADAAARANAVVYSIQAKAAETVIPDIIGEKTEVTYRTRSGERLKAQNGMSDLAQATGGKFINNQSDLSAALDSALTDSSHYYLLAWQPEDENEQPEKLRKIEISVKNRPELKVRTQAGYLDALAKPDSAPKSSESTADQRLVKALFSPVSSDGVGSALELYYTEAEDGKANLLGVLQINWETIDFAKAEDKMTASVVLAAVIYNSKGKKIEEFSKLITNNYPLNGNPSKGRYNIQAKLKPDLYQVRIALRDEKSGSLGNQSKWIDIPNLKKKELAIGSVLLKKTAKSQYPDAAPDNNAEMSVDHIFIESDSLEYIFFVYNAKNASNPSVTTQAKILHNGKPIAQTSQAAIKKNEKDASSLAYAAEIPLKSLSVGRYELQIVVNDHIAKSQAERIVKFEIR